MERFIKSYKNRQRMFCKRCGSILVPEKDKMVCGCGYSEPLSRKEMKDPVERKEDLKVLEDRTHPLATTEHTCPKCGFGKAWLINRGIWYTDEDECVEYKCGRCGKHSRDSNLKVT